MRHLLTAIVPHAPLLVEELASDEVAPDAALIRKAVASLPLGDRRVVLVSPHGATTGVYGSTRGSLAGFGIPDVAASWAPGDQGRDLAERWGRPLISDEADHGIVVPLLLGLPATAVIAVTLEEGAAPDELAREVDGLVAALGSDDRMALVVSANGAAGLSARAPLSERPEAKRLQDELLDALARDPARIEAVARELARTEASCGYGPLRAYAHANPGAPARVLAHVAPVGVGYTVAVADG